LSEKPPSSNGTETKWRALTVPSIEKEQQRHKREKQKANGVTYGDCHDFGARRQIGEKCRKRNVKKTTYHSGRDEKNTVPEGAGQREQQRGRMCAKKSVTTRRATQGKELGVSSAKETKRRIKCAGCPGARNCSRERRTCQ